MYCVLCSLVGLLSFMCTDELTTGSVMMSSRERRLLAAQSHAYNIRQRRFTQLFPEYVGPMAKDLPNMSRPANMPAAAAKAPEAKAPAPTAAQEPAPEPAPEPAQEPSEAQDTLRENREAHDAPRSYRGLAWTAGVVLLALFSAKVIEKLAK